MAKWHNSNVRLHSLARKWFHFHKLCTMLFDDDDDDDWLATHLYKKVFSQETHLKLFTSISVHG